MKLSILFDALRPHFQSGKITQPQVKGVETICAAFAGVPDERWTAYALATAYHETAFTMEPVRETLAANDDQAIRRLNRAWKDGRLKHVRTPYWLPDQDGFSWFGRGYVQLTHKSNYELAARKLGHPLDRNPSLALNPEIAALILKHGSIDGWFRPPHNLPKYFNMKIEDPMGAREVINGPDGSAKAITGYYLWFLDALRKAR